VSDSAVERVLVPDTRDLGGGFQVRRALPSSQCRMVGPFVFFDQFGPTLFHAGAGLDVRPHPHIGLATVTYLFEGEIMHRDSLGSAQLIRPGEVNWMIAGSGIVHSERTTNEARRAASSLAGIQTWVALPQHEEQRPPSFTHHAVHELPLIEAAGRRIRLIAGSLYGEHAPVATLSPMGYAEALLQADAQLEFAAEYEQRAIYVVAGAVEASGQHFEAGRLLVLRAREIVRLRSPSGARLMLFGGEPLDGPRHLWWNFVSSSRQRIEEAGQRWRDGHFGRVPGDEREFIPLPQEVAPAARSPPDGSAAL
jgi:redox-sensitive bicupin YhaK (pirin superfamily)